MKTCNHPCCGPVCRKIKAPKPRKPINKVSVKRKVKDSLYKQRANAFKKANPFCKARMFGCTGLTQDVHHSKGRVGDNYLDESTWIPVCRICHLQIEANPVVARNAGLSSSRLNKK